MYFCVFFSVFLWHLLYIYIYIVAIIEDAFLTLYRRIRADPVFKNVTIMVVVENNFGNDAGWIHALMKRSPEINNTYMLSDNIAKKIGTNTTELSKIRGYDILKTFIATNGLKFYRRMITFNNEYERAFPGPDPRAAMRSLMIQQIKQIKQFGKRKAGGSAEMFISGIHTEDKKRLPLVDDVLMALIFFLTMAIRFSRRDIPNVPYNKIENMRYDVRHYSEQEDYINRNVSRKLSQRETMRQQINETGLFV